MVNKTFFKRSTWELKDALKMSGIVYPNTMFYKECFRYCLNQVMFHTWTMRKSKSKQVKHGVSVPKRKLTGLKLQLRLTNGDSEILASDWPSQFDLNQWPKLYGLQPTLLQGLVGFGNLRFAEIKSCPSASPKWRFHAKNSLAKLLLSEKKNIKN